MGRSTRRGPWLPEEDATLLHLVHIQGPNNWVRISQHMQHRSPKQCRERYHQNLKPSLNHEPINNDEGEVIEQLVQEMGKRWAEIARRLGNRSDNAVKNWWNGSMNRRRRSTTHGTVRAVGPRQLPVPATGPRRTGKSFSPTAAYDSSPRPYLSPNRLHPSVFHTDVVRTDQMDGAIERQTVSAGLERHISSRPIGSTYSIPTQPDPRRPSLVTASLSAPGSFQASSGESFPRHLQPPLPRHGLRPPPLEYRPASHSDWQIPRLQEASAISPAATEYSNAASFHQAPSLISDSQSHYSISPKTISSPRPSMPAPIETSNQNWYAEQRRNSYIGYSQSGKGMQDEGYVSALPPSALNEPAPEAFPLDPSLRRRVSQSDIDTRSDARLRPVSSPTTKDSRMTVSSLLD